MYNKVASSTVIGIDGAVINVEADVSDGLPMFSMVGCLSSSVKEAGERVKTALRNSGFFLPPKRVTINLSPGNIKKYGTGFDLPIAVSILLCLGITPSEEHDISKTIIIGELGLNGVVKPVAGVLPMVYDCEKMGYKTFIVPKDNANEASLVREAEIYGVSSLKETVELILGHLPCIRNKCAEAFKCGTAAASIDFSDIKGQETIKRGVEIATAGFHNILMTGAAGAGKSMIAKRIPTIMPAMSFEESVDVTKIYSISGMLDNDNFLMSERPFRSPHHTITSQALVGGGINPKPGEVSLSHNGVLFLDELPEFNKNVLEVLRQPIEDKKVNISRVNAAYAFPADFMLVAAMNPCPCGFYPDKRCTCTSVQIKKYQGKISGPLLDRIDICIEVKPVEYEKLFEEGVSRENSEVIRSRVEAARQIQLIRYKDAGISFNSQLDGAMIKRYIPLKNEVEDDLKNLIGTTPVSARGINRIIKLSRTIADLDGASHVEKKHMIEAFFFRNCVDRLSGGDIYNA